MDLRLDYWRCRLKRTHRFLPTRWMFWELSQMGMIGYLIEQELRNCLSTQPIVTVLTQIEADPHDPAFQIPIKFIGPSYGEAEARRLDSERSYAIAPDGNAYRHVVPSPKPKAFTLCIMFLNRWRLILLKHIPLFSNTYNAVSGLLTSVAARFCIESSRSWLFWR